MTARIFHVDAFTDVPFAGNPAAVCLLTQEQSQDWMQSVAAEMNLSETAFVRILAKDYELRWFTPAMEVELCGHATLASAHILWTQGFAGHDESVRFQTKSGVLTCKRTYIARYQGYTRCDYFRPRGQPSFRLRLSILCAGSWNR